MTTVGFLGLGIMGNPMASNLLAAGHSLFVWNRTHEKAAPLIQKGAVHSEDIAALVSSSNEIVIMVYGPEALLAIAKQLAADDLTGKVIINCSTVSVEASITANQLITASGGAFLDAPVSGSTGPAAAGELVFMVGGEDKAIAQAEPLFQAMGKKTVRCGPVGSGTRMKLAIQILLGNILGGLSEAMVFAQQVGLDHHAFMEVANNGAMACPMVEAKGGMIANKDFGPVSPMHQLGKDIGLALEEANIQALNLPQSQDLCSTVQDAMDSGLIEQDVAAIYQFLEAKQTRPD